MSTHNLCFQAEIRKCIPCKPQFYYIKVGFKGVYGGQNYIVMFL